MDRRRLKCAICAACIGMLGLTIAQFAWSQKPLRAEPPPAYAKGNKQKIEAYVVLLRLRHDLYLRWKKSGQKYQRLNNRRMRSLSSLASRPQ